MLLVVLDMVFGFSGWAHAQCLPDVRDVRSGDTVTCSGIDSEGYEGDFSLPQIFEIKKEFPYAAIGVVITTILAIIIL